MSSETTLPAPAVRRIAVNERAGEIAMKRSEWILAVLSCSAFVSFTARAQPGPLWQSTTYKGQEIGKLTGDVYYARTDDYVSAFMVTKDGIVLVEPVGPDHA